MSSHRFAFHGFDSSDKVIKVFDVFIKLGCFDWRVFDKLCLDGFHETVQIGMVGPGILIIVHNLTVFGINDGMLDPLCYEDDWLFFGIIS